MAPAPNFHARAVHGATFQKLANQLCLTFEVRKDHRVDHPKGYVAFTQNWGGEVYRVDFDLATDTNGDIMLVVTGWRMDE